MSGRLTLLSHAPTASQRLSAFPSGEAIESSAMATLTALNWPAPRARQIFAAPELRTQQTARALNLVADLVDELRDFNYGSWRGRALADLHAEDPEGVAAWLTDPTAAPHGGESIATLVGRIAGWLDALPATGPGHTLAVTHPAVIRAAVLHTLDAPLRAFWRIDIAPLTLTDLRHNGRVWTLRSMALPLAHLSVEQGESEQ